MYMKEPDIDLREPAGDSGGRHLKKLSAMLVLLWVTAIALSLLWNWGHAQKTAMRIAEEEGSATYEKDLVYRMWNAKHGGVYVPVTPETPPNPHLAHITERDIRTPSGRHAKQLRQPRRTPDSPSVVGRSFGSVHGIRLVAEMAAARDCAVGDLSTSEHDRRAEGCG